jgi:hypothetical protein
MQEQTDSNTVSTTGRGYNRHLTDAEHAATGVATDLYTPETGTQNDPQSQTTTDRRTTPATGSRTHADLVGRENEAYASSQQRYDTTRRSSTSTTTDDRWRTSQSDNVIMQKIQENPLAVVAAATAGGMLIGRLMRNRSQRHDDGYLRGTPSRYFQPYQPPRYQPQSFRPYQVNAGYQMQGGRYTVPQYQAEQQFRPEQGFQGRHENFPGGSNWD